MRISNLITIFVIFFLSMVISPVIHMHFNLGRFLGVNPLTTRNVIILIQMMIFSRKPGIFWSKPMLFVYFYYYVFFIMSATGYYDTNSQWFWQFHFPVYFSTLIFTYYTSVKDYRGLGKVMIAALIFTTFSGVLNVIQLLRFPDAARSQTWGVFQGGAYAELSAQYARIGVAGITFVFSIPFLIPVIIGVFKQYADTRQQKIAMILLALLILYSTYLSAITAALLLAIAGFMVGFLGSRRFKSSMVTLVFFTLFMVVVPKSITSSGFYYISGLIGNEDTSTKFKDMGTSIEEGINVDSPTNSVESRVERVPANINSFLRHPLFGQGFEENAHIFWLNYLAQFGIIGAFPLILILYKTYKRNILLFSSEFHFYYFVAFILFVVSGLMKAYSGGMFYYMFLVLPGVYYLSVFSKKATGTEIAPPLPEGVAGA